MAPMNLGLGLGLSRRVGGTVAAAAPVITGNPTISGTIRTGQELTATPASVSGSPTPTRTWQWVRAGVDIVGATAQTYTLTNLDEGRNITVRQTETNASGSVNATSSATAVPFLLDQLTATAAAAYSFRKLRDGANLANRIRRNDAVEQDFGFLADGQFNYAAFNAFLGAGSGTGRTWYDQSVNAVHYQQTDPLRQPRVRLSGVDFLVGTKPAFSFEGSGTSTRYFERSPFLFAGGAASASFAVQSTNPGNTGSLLQERNGAAGNGGSLYALRRESGGALGFDVRNDAGTQTAISQQIVGNAFDGNVNIVSFRDSGALARGLRDGNPGVNLTYSRGAGPYTFTTHLFGGSWVFGGTAGFIPAAEAIYFTSEISNLDMNTIIASQGGEYGSAVVPFLSDVERLQLINGTGDAGASFGVGIAGYGEPMLTDIAKQSRGWVLNNLSTPIPLINRDADGAVTSIPSGDTVVRFFFSTLVGSSSSYTTPKPNFASRLRLTFTGSATVDFSNAGASNITQINPNTYEFDCDFNGDKWLVFTPTAFPLKVTLVKTSDIAAHAGGQIFAQSYLDHLPSGGCARFMVWNDPNFYVPTTFAAANLPLSAQRWSPTPYEVAKQLCVTKNYDGWFCIPYAADDAFVTDMATWLRDNFPVGRKIRIELSNENWNTDTFSANGTHWKGLAESVWGVADGYINPSGAWLSYAGKRFVQVMQIFNSVFAGQTHRLIGLIGGQADGSTNSIRQLDAPQWQVYEPGSYVPPHTFAKELSIAPYINYVDRVAQGNALKAQLDISHTAAVNYVLNTMVPAGLAQAKARIDTHVKIAADRNLRLTAYEYNQHFDLYGMRNSAMYSGGNPVPGALDVMVEASFSQAMADAQDELRDYFKAQGGSLMCFFVDYQRVTEFGSWGAKTHLSHNSPPWNDLQTWHAANPRWWSQ